MNESVSQTGKIKARLIPMPSLDSNRVLSVYKKSYSRMSETENANGAASRGRKLQSARVGTLKSSIVQYWDK